LTALVLSLRWIDYQVSIDLKPALMGGWGLMLLYFVLKSENKLKGLLPHGWVVCSVLTYVFMDSAGLKGQIAHPFLWLTLGAGDQLLKSTSCGEEASAKKWRILWIASACLVFWVYTSRLSLFLSAGFLMTLSWMIAGFLMLSLGLLIKERVYRWSGFIVIGAGLGRVLLYDIWKLSLGYRIVTLHVTGIAFLVLGYVYNRNHEKMKQWL